MRRRANKTTQLIEMIRMEEPRIRILSVLLFVALLAGCLRAVDSWTLDENGGVFWTNGNGTIRAFPATSNDLIHHEQYLNSSYNGTNGTVNMSFVFPNTVSNFRVFAWYGGAFHDVTDTSAIQSNFTNNTVFSFLNVPFPNGSFYMDKIAYDMPRGSAGKYNIYAHSGSPASLMNGTAQVFLELDPWWNSTFLNKVQVNITGATCQNAFCQFPIYVALNASLTNGSDIRILNASENALVPFWREDNNGSVYSANYAGWNFSNSSGNIWVNVSNNTQMIYIYYKKNGSAADMSNISAISIIGDDFSDGTLNKWSNLGTSTTVGLNGTADFIPALGQCTYFNTSVNISSLGNISFVYRMRYDATYIAYSGLGKNNDVDLAAETVYNSATGWIYSYYNGTGSGASSGLIDSLAWRTIRIDLANSSSVSFYTLNNVYLINTTYTTNAYFGNSLQYMRSCRHPSGGSTTHMDFFLVGYMPASAPSITVGAQQSQFSIETAASFNDAGAGHSFNATAGANEGSGASNVVGTNASTTLGTCAYVYNSTSGNTFNVTFNCTSFSPGTATVKIGFSDATGSYVESSGAHAYPDNTSATLGKPTIAAVTYLSTAFCAGGAFSDFDGDLENVSARAFKWYWNGTEISGQTANNLSISSLGIPIGANISCYENATNSTWVGSWANNTSINVTVGDIGGGGGGGGGGGSITYVNGTVPPTQNLPHVAGVDEIFASVDTFLKGTTYSLPNAGITVLALLWFLFVISRRGGANIALLNLVGLFVIAMILFYYGKTITGGA